MRAQVDGEAALLSECLGADVAAVWLLARVCAQVDGERSLNKFCIEFLDNTSESSRVANFHVSWG